MIALWIIIVLYAGSVWAVDEDELASFGYRELGSASMPLLTILLDFDSGNFNPDHDTEFYRRLLFSDGKRRGSLAGRGSFYAEQSADEFSLGAFTFTNAGILGPFPHPDDPKTVGNEQDFACARGIDSSGNAVPPFGYPGIKFRPAPCGLWAWNAGATPPRWDNKSVHKTLTNAIIAADRWGFPFDDFDENIDGIIDQSELAILVIFAPPKSFSPIPGTSKDYSTGGVTRNTSVTPVTLRDGLEIRLTVSTVGQSTAAATITHELAHLLQRRIGWTFEGYGSGRCLNNKFTNMSCTIVRAADDRTISHFDPYTKMRFGFLQPEIAHLGDSLCLTMQPIEYPRVGPNTRSVILYDPDRGPDEYFILDYRRPLLFNYDGDPFGTGRYGLPDKGLGIWYVKIGENGTPVRVDALDGRAKKDPALFLVPPGFADYPMRWGLPSANNGLWGPEDGAAMLTWPNGTSTGTEVRVLREQSGELFLQVAEPEGPTCLNVPEPTLTEFLRIDQGVDHWDNGLLSVTRKIGTPIVSGTHFAVEYTLMAHQDMDGPVIVTDDFQGDFVPIQGQKPSLTFPQLVQGQSVTLSYSMQAGEASGGFELLTELALLTSTDNLQNLGSPETYEISSFVSLWNPNEVVLGDNVESDSDGDDIFDSGDECPNENAYGFDSDRDGCIDTLDDIAEIIEGLSDKGVISPGIAHSFLKKILNAGKAVSRSNYSAAKGLLQSFQRELKALEVKKVPEYEAFLLLSFAETIESQFVSLDAKEGK
jgi:hypothetical protein